MLPAAVSLLSDPATLVRLKETCFYEVPACRVLVCRVQSIKTITRLTECVRSVSLANANVFPEYILVHLSGIVGKKGDHEVFVFVFSALQTFCCKATVPIDARPDHLRRVYPYSCTNSSAVFGGRSRKAKFGSQRG
jgi:hypothetical protein